MNLFGAIGYAVSACALALLAVLLATAWRGHIHGRNLIVAVVVTSAWSAGMALQAWQAPLPFIAIYVLEVVRYAAWLRLLVAANQSLPVWLGRSMTALWIGLLAAGLLLELAERTWTIADGPGRLLPYAGLLLALATCVMLEQLYRSAVAQSRWALRPLAIALGIMCAFDLFLYSQINMLNGIDGQIWSARGFVFALPVPLLAVTARRSTEWSVRVFVSRQVVLFTTSLIAVGAYLVLMSIGGFYIRATGGTWGRAAQIIFLAGAGIALVVAVGSVDLRRRLTVFIGKHFYQNKYDYRLEWLRFIGTLSAPDEDDIHRTSVRAVAQIFDGPGGALFVLKDGERRYEARSAWPMFLEDLTGLQSLEASTELMQFMERRRWIVDLNEYRRDPGIYQNIALPEWLLRDERWRIVSPMLQGERMVGFFLLYEPVASFNLTYEDRDLLLTVGRHVATHIAQHETNLRLTEAHQFQAYNRLTAFMMHDLKNSVAQLQLILANSARHRNKPEFIDDALHTVENTVARMTRLLDQLRGGAQRAVAVPVNVQAALEAAIRHCGTGKPVPVLQSVRPIEVLADRERLTTTFEHVMRNAQDATGEGGAITVDVALAGPGAACITIADTGGGMSPEFVRERLFRPFDSTKGSKGMGIGAYQVREYVRQLGGDVEVQSSPGAGTRFSITLPVSTPVTEVPVARGRVS